MKVTLIDSDSQQQLLHFRARLERRMKETFARAQPASIYDPLRYILSAAGKRLRGMLVLLSCEAVGGNADQALDAAAAIELLHNFTLVHDDVMDNAAVRRGKQTIHTKWDSNIAILAGDLMIAHAYQSLLKTEAPHIEQIIEIFTQAFIDVCAGQALDKAYERRSTVGMSAYRSMIEKKTAAMIASSCEIGARIGGGTDKEVMTLREFGNNLGIAFQIQDDLLDIIGDEEEFGKRIGGDVMEGKKTFLLVKALKKASARDRTTLTKIQPNHEVTLISVSKVLAIYKRIGVLDDARKEIIRYTRIAERRLAPLKSSATQATLHWLSHQLLHRTS